MKAMFVLAVVGACGDQSSNPDARDRSDASSTCSVSTSNFGSVVPTNVMAADVDVSFFASGRLEAGDPADSISVVLRPLNGEFAKNGFVPGVYPIRQPRPLCDVCLVLSTNNALATGDYEDLYVAISGTFNLIQAPATSGDTLEFTIADAAFRHADSDNNENYTLDPDNCATTIGSLSISATIE